MARAKSTLRQKAFKLWVDSGRTLTPTQIAEQLGTSRSLISRWRYEENWDEQPDKKPRGAPKGNKNAVGNSGGPGGPEGNSKALKHGAYSRFLPRNERFQEILKEVQEMEPLDMLWTSIEIAFSKLIYAQDVTFVESSEDHDVLVKKESDKGVEYQHIRARDKQATDITSFATISREFRGAVRQFLVAAPERDERRLKLEQMEAMIERTKAQTEKLKPPKEDKGKKLEDFMS